MADGFEAIGSGTACSGPGTFGSAYVMRSVRPGRGGPVVFSGIWVRPRTDAAGAAPAIDGGCGGAESTYGDRSMKTARPAGISSGWVAQGTG